MEFKRYSSIENSYRQKFLDKMVEEGKSGGKFCVQEKVHGANFGIWIDSDTIRYSKRSGFIKENENFFSYEEVVDQYEERIRGMFDLLNATEGVEQMTIFGELYGGIYPHPDVKPNHQSAVQKDVFYSPEQDFVAFDIKLNGVFVDVFKFVNLCMAHQIPFIDTLFIGPLQACLEYDNEFQTIIPKLKGLPEIENNFCEGTVVRPIEPMFLYDRSRVILKNKNEKFAEKEYKPKKVREPLPDLSVEAMDLLDELNSYLTENRLKNVISKIGEIKDKDFGKLMGLFQKDAIEDFRKDHGEVLGALSKAERKRIQRMSGQEAATLIRKNFVNIIDGIF